MPPSCALLGDCTSDCSTDESTCSESSAWHHRSRLLLRPTPAYRPSDSLASPAMGHWGACPAPRLPTV